MLMQFGKYKGIELADVPADYIEWLLKDEREKVSLYETELQRRKLRLDHSFMNRIVQAGYQVILANATTSEAKAQLDLAYKLLTDAIKDAATK